MKSSDTKARPRAALKGRTNARRVAVVTGTRAEYGLLKSTMTALSTHEAIELQLIVTGSHLLRKFGHTIDEIAADGWTIDAQIAMQCGDDDALDQAGGLARGIDGMARFLVKGRTDMVVVLGDRIEAMAGALAAATTGRFLAHIHGGDLAAGDLDDRLRHAITKLAQLHFPATREAGRRIHRMGEDKARIHVVGAPGLDRVREILESQPIPGRLPRSRDRARQALVVQHPSGRSSARERETMSKVLQACEEESLHVTCLYPNTDAGHRGILHAIEQRQRSARNGEFRAIPSLPRDAFLRTMRDSDVLIGNSSSGIIESAYVGTPAVNVGDRQKGRQICGPSVIHCAEETAAIRTSLRKALTLRRIRPAAAYGDGQAGRKIASVLAGVPLSDELRRKLNRY